MDEGRGGVRLKRECLREGSELDSSWEKTHLHLLTLTRWMDKGRGGLPLKRECLRKEKTSAQKIYS
jgi:hypothetical protein